LGGGSTYSGTAGSWSASEFYTATGAVSVVGTSGATFYITGVQLEQGTVATPFDYRNYGQELALCQRYFESSYVYVSATLYPLYYKVSKRVAPVVTGGGAGFSSSAVITTEQTFTSQTTGAFQTLQFNSEL
jgi:hypothetical protein